MSRIAPFEENTIIVGDCLDIIKQMPDESVDLVVTDPPYGIGFQSNSAKVSRFDILEGDNKVFDLTQYWQELFRVVKDGGA